MARNRMREFTRFAACLGIGFFALLALAATIVACSSGSGSTPEPDEPLPPEAASRPQAQLSTSPPAPPAPFPTGLPAPVTVAVASTDLAVGDNRVVFALIGQAKGSVKDAQVDVQTFLLTDAGPDGPRQNSTAAPQVWPGGSRGVYVSNLTFDRAGEWGLGFDLRFPDGSEAKAGTRVRVKTASSTPAVGALAPRSLNKTVNDVSRLDDLTTDPAPDPDLYAKTISDALVEGKPLIVAFATPAYCKTATCGPQLDVVKELKDRFSDRMNFIHVEVYDNPPEIRDEGIAAAKVSPTLDEWGLPSEPWTFVIDAGGVITAKYEGFAASDELEAAIDSVLRR